MCGVLKSTIHTSSLKPIFSHEAHASIWSEARDFYTSDTPTFVLCLPSPFDTIYAYLGWIHVALHDFHELLPPSADVRKKHENHVTFFMTLALYGLPLEYVTTCD